ncbi:MAG: hypothetical protein H6Q72_4206 [Firmicutes bacterium]|nr:hypothetical protein [Bacillota bacterium]
MPNVARMVGQAFRDLEERGIKPKAIASQCNYSVDAFYKVINAGRSIPTQARKQLAKMHPLLGLAAAAEATDYSIFDRPECDRHIQSVFQHVFKEHEEADVAIKPLPRILLDKSGPGDLTPDVRQSVVNASKEICDDVQWKLELLIDLENQYKLGIVDSCLLTKAKAACAGTQTTFK